MGRTQSSGTRLRGRINQLNGLQGKMVRVSGRTQGRDVTQYICGCRSFRPEDIFHPFPLFNPMLLFLYWFHTEKESYWIEPPYSVFIYYHNSYECGYYKEYPLGQYPYLPLGDLVAYDHDDGLVEHIVG